MQIGVEVSRAVENRRVFVVERDEIIRAALQFMLHDENETHEMANLEQAFAKGRDWKPDLVLLGIDFLRGEEADVLAGIAARLPSAKILLVAESIDDPAALAALRAGAHAVLEKPLTIESVRYKADVLLGRRTGPVMPFAVLRQGPKQ